MALAIGRLVAPTLRCIAGCLSVPSIAQRTTAPFVRRLRGTAAKVDDGSSVTEDA